MRTTFRTNIRLLALVSLVGGSALLTGCATTPQSSALTGAISQAGAASVIRPSPVAANAAPVVQKQTPVPPPDPAQGAAFDAWVASQKPAQPIYNEPPVEPKKESLSVSECVDRGECA